MSVEIHNMLGQTRGRKGRETRQRSMDAALAAQQDIGITSATGRTREKLNAGVAQMIITIPKGRGQEQDTVGRPYHD